MTTTFSRTVTFSVSAVSLGPPLDEASLSKLRDDGFQRLQRATSTLIEQGIHSGTLTYQDRNPPVNLNWSIRVSDDPAPLESGPRAPA